MNLYRKPLTTYHHQIANAIQAGVVIQVEKTKQSSSGGRQWVTLGKYATAIPCCWKYAMYVGREQYLFSNPTAAAQAFIEHCNREIAWKGAVESVRKAINDGTTKFKLQFMPY